MRISVLLHTSLQYMENNSPGTPQRENYKYKVVQELYKTSRDIKNKNVLKNCLEHLNKIATNTGFSRTAQTT